MTVIAFKDGKVVMRDGKVGEGKDCCCGRSLVCDCDSPLAVTISLQSPMTGLTHTCNNGPRDDGRSFGGCSNYFNDNSAIEYFYQFDEWPQQVQQVPNMFGGVDFLLSNIYAQAAIQCGSFWGLEPGEWSVTLLLTHQFMRQFVTEDGNAAVCAATILSYYLGLFQANEIGQVTTDDPRFTLTGCSRNATPGEGNPMDWIPCVGSDLDCPDLTWNVTIE